MRILIILAIAGVVFSQHPHFHQPHIFGAPIAAPVIFKPKPYAFGYGINDAHGTDQHRHESGDENGFKKGSYGYKDAHGIYRQVDYVADAHGFRAVVRTNEPGTSSKDPAHVKMLANPVMVAHNVHHGHGYGPRNLYGVPAHAPAAVYGASVPYGFHQPFAHPGGYGGSPFVHYAQFH